MRGHRAPSRVRCEKGGSAERRSPLPASPVRREERSPTRDRPAIVGSRSNVQGGARGKAALVAARAASTRVSSARAREDTHCLCRRDRLPRPAPTPANHRPRSAPRAGPRADEAPPGPPGDGSRPACLARPPAWPRANLAYGPQCSVCARPKAEPLVRNDAGAAVSARCGVRESGETPSYPIVLSRFSNARATIDSSCLRDRISACVVAFSTDENGVGRDGRMGRAPARTGTTVPRT